MKKLLLISHALIFTVAVSVTAGISADSPCKGLSQNECTANDKCTWVSGYTQKDGDKVKAYCRAKPGQGDSDKSEKKAKKKKEKSEEAVKADEGDDKAAKNDKKNKGKKKTDKEDKADKAEVKEDKKAKKESKNKKKSKKDE